MSLLEISKKYRELSAIDCCPSCGNAIKYAGLKEGETGVFLRNGKDADTILSGEMRVKAGFLYLIDPSGDSLPIEKSDNFKFLKSHFEKINLEEGIADLVIANCSIYRSSDKQAVWNEIFRILKRGGRFVVTDHYLIESYPYKSKSGPVTRDEYLDQLARAGFSTITIFEESPASQVEEETVSSWTISGEKPLKECDWCNE